MTYVASPDAYFDAHGYDPTEPANDGGGFRPSGRSRNGAAPPPFPVEWFGDVAPVLETREIVEGLLVAGTGAVIYGASNAGKSFFTMDLALHVAAGLPWHGRRVEQGGVLYLALEGGSGVRNRIAAWRRDRGLEGEAIPFALVACPVNLLDPGADALRLVATVRNAEQRSGHRFSLIVVDTLARAFAGGNENASEDMGALVATMDAVREETGAAVLFVHHSGKDEAKGARGHSCLRAAIDTEIEVRADEETGARTATVAKQRDLAKGGAIGFRLRPVELGRDQHGKPVTSCVVDADADAGPARPKGKPLTTEEQGWLRDIQDVFADPGTSTVSMRPLPDMATVACATRDAIRDGLVRKGRLGVAPGVALSATERSRLLRMLNRLKDRGKISLTDRWVWLA